jgi:tetratricopeptide (TPR) repeat protein
MFAKAKGTPAYAAAKGKGWAAALDTGWASLLDPAAIARRSVSNGPKKDALAAARYLDAGVMAYKSGRFADAEKALAEAAWQDPNDALAWYFLGASRWARGKTDEAQADYKQGAEREQQRIVPTRQIDSALAPIQGPARDALSAARP